MNLIVFSCLFLIAVNLAFGRPNETVKTCTTEGQWMEDCNTCWCTADGTGKACTKKACEPKNEKECEPNSTWKNKCNDCWCNAEGTAAACTLKGCDEPFLQIVTEKISG